MISQSTMDALEIETSPRGEEFQEAIARVARESGISVSHVTKRINERIVLMRSDVSPYVRDLACMIPFVERSTVLRALKCERSVSPEMLFRILRYGLELSLEECAYLEALRNVERSTQTDLLCMQKGLP